jgi:predicted DNA-binding transcriptional regulator AlpA
MAELPTISPEEIASLLGIRRATFLRKRASLHTKGFPRPLPLGLTTPVYSRALVLAWIENNGLPPETVVPSDPVAAAREALEARIGRAAA